MRRILATGSLLVLASCGGDKNNPLNGLAQGLSATDLQGDWVSGCAAAPRLFPFQRQMVSLRGNDAAVVTRAFADASCATPLMEVRETGHFETGGSSPGGNNIQFALDKASFRPMGPSGLAYANGAHLCGATDWAADIERDVTAPSGGADCWDRTPRQLFDIYTIEGRTLLLGRGHESDKTSGDRRPVEVDRGVPFAKQ